MSGSKEGWRKARLKLLERYGGEEGLLKHYQEIGSAGGKESKGGGFVTMDPIKHSEVSSRGGKKSRRNPARY